MGSIGEQLSKARQAQGLSVAEVAARLRIRSQYVEALENEHWSAVGEFVYVRGFLKNYAHLLGLDAQPMLVYLTAHYQPYPPVRGNELPANGATVPPSYTSYVAASPPHRPWFPWVMGSLTALAAVLVVMVVIGVVGLFNGARSSNSAVQPPAATTAAPAAQATIPGVDNAGAQTSGVNLRLQLTQRSWLSVIVDGKRVVYETLPAGTVREFHGEREITLRAGNAGGVMANIDGKDLGALGQAGQVEDRVFAVKTPIDQLNRAHE